MKAARTLPNNCGFAAIAHPLSCHPERRRGTSRKQIAYVITYVICHCDREVLRFAQDDADFDIEIDSPNE